MELWMWILVGALGLALLVAVYDVNQRGQAILHNFPLVGHFRGWIAALGPPLDLMLAPYLPEHAIVSAGDRFRALYPDHAIASVPLLPGAAEALAAVRSRGGRVVVVTGKYAPNARLHLDHLGLEVDALEGWVWGAGKAESLRREGASVYVGDHVHDVEGALAADIVSLSVLTGGCSREDLLAAGTHAVLDDLRDFPSWLDARDR